MRPLNLDLSRGLTLRPSTPVGSMLGSLLLILLASCLFAVPIVLFSMEMHADSLLSSRKPSLSRPKPMSTNLPSKDQIQDVNRTIGQLNVPWTDLFDAIEANSNGDVALLDVEPLASARIVHVTAECAGSDDMIEYLNGFMRNGYFTSVSLKQHQVQVTNGARTLRFWFDLGWAAGADQANAS